MADEIYEKILFDDARAPPRRDVRRRRRALPDLQRAVQGLPGLRLPRRLGDDLRAQATWPTDFLEGLTLLANMRMCANVPGPARDPDRARRLPVDQGADRPRRPVLRAEQCWPTGCSTRSPGVSSRASRAARCTASRGWTPRSTPIEDDEAFVIDLLRAKKILVTHGTGFNWFEPDHFRLVTLPDVEVLTEAIGRIADFLAARAGLTSAVPG